MGFRDFMLTVNCMASVPMYSMLIWMTIYYSAIYFAPTTWLRMLLLAYTPYCILDPTPKRGQRWFPQNVVEFCRSFIAYKGVAAYFPVKLHKTVDLDASKPYIFLYHPHGVIGMGANTALNTNACNFHKVFPGIRRWAVTLNATFYAPIFREWLLISGFISANKSTLTSKLQKHESIVLVPGGAAEALHAHHTNFKCYIKDRQGFVRLALETGALPVPVLGFGENEAFQTYYAAESSTTNKLFEWQQRLCKLFSV